MNGPRASAGDRCDARPLLRLTQLLEDVLGPQRGAPRFMPLAREDLDRGIQPRVERPSSSAVKPEAGLDVPGDIDVEEVFRAGESVMPPLFGREWVCHRLAD